MEANEQQSKLTNKDCCFNGCCLCLILNQIYLSYLNFILWHVKQKSLLLSYVNVKTKEALPCIVLSNLDHILVSEVKRWKTVNNLSCTSYQSTEFLTFLITNALKRNKGTLRAVALGTNTENVCVLKDTFILYICLDNNLHFCCLLSLICCFSYPLFPILITGLRVNCVILLTDNCSLSSTPLIPLLGDYSLN